MTLPPSPNPLPTTEGVTQDANEGQSEKDYCQDATRPYRKQIRETPGLMSLLYDIDLMPEQIVKSYNVGRMIAVCELWKQAFPAEPLPPPPGQ